MCVSWAGDVGMAVVWGGWGAGNATEVMGHSHCTSLSRTPMVRKVILKRLCTGGWIKKDTFRRLLRICTIAEGANHPMRGGASGGRRVPGGGNLLL